MIVQKMLFPDPFINSERDLFFHAQGGLSGCDFTRRVYYADAKEVITFDTFYNAFPLALYDLSQEHNVYMNITLKGECIVTIFQAHWHKSWDVLSQTKLKSEDDFSVIKLQIPLTHTMGVIYSAFSAVTPIEIADIEYIVEGEVRNDVSITACITTYKRDDAVQDTCHRMENYFSQNPDMADKFHLLVVDNGGDTKSIPYSAGRLVENPNYGGAGGFMRGLLEVTEHEKTTHVLFMDDDASFFPESIRRTLAVLSFNPTPNLAISGSMITSLHKWMMWEDTAYFSNGCHPYNRGKDLRLFNDVLACFYDKPPVSKKRYGGWWYFCFPVAAVEKSTFPFFVRGDDIYFSLNNNFQITTIPGVASIQDDFSIKQSPFTLYLDMRNHIVQNLTFPALGGSWRKDLKMLFNFFNRFNSSYHYETAACISIALRDVLEGAGFWDANLAMGPKMAEIKSHISNEKIIENFAYEPDDVFGMRGAPRGRLRWLMRKVTLNGHLIPKFLFFRKGRIMPLSDRPRADQVYRRSFGIHIDHNTRQGYKVEFNRGAYFRNLGTFLKLILNYVRNYQKLKHIYGQYREQRCNMQNWKKRLELAERG
ncbi:glycosyltransferase [Shinella sp.]|uniref:glycosyltransferase family 2 protein n=1 Tax=Shinella sp. TaxID=1870904 RepID=UPI0028A020D8|nr:glycosyltransferase [Shinella sp.]